MHVAFVSELFHPHLGGAEYRTFQFARGLAQRAHRVTVYTVDYSNGSLPQEETVDGVRIVRWTKLPGYIGPRGRSLLAMVRFGNRAAELLTDGISEQNDAVVVNQWPLLHLLRVRPGGLPPRTVVDWCEWWDLSPWEPVFARAALRSRGAICVEDHIAARVRSANPRGRVRVVRTPVPLDLFRGATETRDPDLVIFVGRIAAQKRVDRLAEAIIHLNEREGAHKRLTVLGDGELRNELEARFSRYPYIRFLGRVPHATKVEYLRRAWLLGLCSRREGMPITVMEAVAAGTPVLTVRSRLNTSNELVEQRGIGVVARSVRASELARSIASLDDEHAWSRASDAGRALLPAFDPKKALEDLERFLAETSGCGPGAAG